MRNPENILINDKNLKQILEEHQHYLKEDCENWKSMRACLTDLNLSYVDFSILKLNLSKVIFKGSIIDNCDFTKCCLRDADFSDTNISHTIFKKADLEATIFTKATVKNVIFDYGYLGGSCLNNISCEKSSFSHANMDSCDLSLSTIHKCNFTFARIYPGIFYLSDLRECDFSNTDIRYSCFHKTCISDTIFDKTNLKGTIFANNQFYGYDPNIIFKDIDISLQTHFIDIPISKDYEGKFDFIPMNCPEEGSFIGYKIGTDKIGASVYLIKLKILEDAKRLSGAKKICRCNKAKVLSIINIRDNESVNECNNIHNTKVNYIVGAISEVDNFSENRWDDADEWDDTYGIHFFMTKQDALLYVEQELCYFI